MKNLSLAESKFNQDKDKVNIADIQKLLDEKGNICANHKIIVIILTLI